LGPNLEEARRTLSQACLHVHRTLHSRETVQKEQLQQLLWRSYHNTVPGGRGGCPGLSEYSTAGPSGGRCRACWYQRRY